MVTQFLFLPPGGVYYVVNPLLTTLRCSCIICKRGLSFLILAWGGGGGVPRRGSLASAE